MVTIDEDLMFGALKAAGLDTGGAISSWEARRLVCGAGLLPAVLGNKSLPVDLGRSQRLFSEGQRVALGLGHETCAAEGCERPYSWCELHHLVPWRLGGPTDLDNAAPLCHFHHRRIHDPRFVHEVRAAGIRFRERRGPDAVQPASGRPVQAGRHPTQPAAGSRAGRRTGDPQADVSGARRRQPCRDREQSARPPAGAPSLAAAATGRPAARRRSPRSRRRWLPRPPGRARRAGTPRRRVRREVRPA